MSKRIYTDAEHASFVVVSKREWGSDYRDGMGPAHQATGRALPTDLERKAVEFVALAVHYRRAAQAMTREIEHPAADCVRCGRRVRLHRTSAGWHWRAESGALPASHCDESRDGSHHVLVNPS